MLQTKISLEEAQIAFLSNHRQLGFRDRSALVRAALESMRTNLDRQRLEVSATLYAEAYCDDPDLRQLTDAALAEWPE